MQRMLKIYPLRLSAEAVNRIKMRRKRRNSPSYLVQNLKELELFYALPEAEKEEVRERAATSRTDNRERRYPDK